MIGRRASAKVAERGGLTASDVAVLTQAASVLLQYPDDERLALRAVVVDALARVGDAGEPLRAFLAATDGMNARDLQEHYVRVLDRRRRACLYLTWWTDGETRRRGLSLATLKALYREHGFELGSGDELPDYLPVMLEFAALVAADGHPEIGLDLLQQHRPGLELLRLALTEMESPYRHAVEAVCALLPGASPADEAAVRALARSGPPGETVGLDGALDPYGESVQLGPTSLRSTSPVLPSSPTPPAGRRPLPLSVASPGGRS